MDLQGKASLKVAIITGAASGIGLETTKLFLKLGASVLGVDINAAPQSLTESSTFKFHQTDLSKDDAANGVVATCKAKYGDRIDILLNIAGVMDTNNSVDTLDPAMWHRVIAINLTAPVMLCKAVIDTMLSQGGGSIVNVASKAGLSGSASGVAYTSSKHGIVGATKNIAFRFRRHGIRCNAICPGGVKTNIGQSVDHSRFDQEATALICESVALHQGGFLDNAASAESHAAMMAFLSSDPASHINGAIIPVDNAWSCI